MKNKIQEDLYIFFTNFQNASRVILKIVTLFLLFFSSTSYIFSPPLFKTVHHNLRDKFQKTNITHSDAIHDTQATRQVQQCARLRDAPKTFFSSASLNF